MTKPPTIRASSSVVSNRMRAVKQESTAPETALRSGLHALGLRFRKNAFLRDAGCCPDIVFTVGRVAVFVDGCFWHGCPIHGTWPKNNAEWWKEKIERNRRRDAAVNERLRQAGWHVVRVWEHEDSGRAAAGLASVVRAARKLKTAE